MGVMYGSEILVGNFENLQLGHKNTFVPDKSFR